MPVIHYSTDDEGIANVVLNDADAPVNTMSARFQRELAELVERLQADRQKYKGVVFSSPKSSFFAGADLRAILKVGPDDARSFFDEIEAMKACLRRIETLGRPVAAAINGHALGGGLELALACHYRVALDDPRSQIGLPEVSLGLLPGAGGVTKSVRLMGIQAALPFLLEGKRLTPKEALAAGYVHALVGERDALLPNARAWVLAHPDARQPWDDPKHRIPGGTPSSPAVAGMLAMAPAMLLAKTRGNLPAPEAILATAVEGAQVDFDTAMRIETRYLTKLATGQVTKNLIGTFFFQMNEVKAGLSRPKDVPKAKVARVGILGAGMMGSGIAWACANRGVPCVLLDRTLERAQKGKAYSGSLLARRVERNRLTPAQAEEILARITPATEAAALRDCDLIIEAVFENRDVKAAITREVEEVIAPTAVFASNTSTLPITGLAGASVRPANFIGLHFFSPVDRMDLVEIIRGRQTSPETVARAYDFVLQIGKTPIVVNDSRGFYTSRVFGTFVNEGLALLGEGVPAATIENAGVQIGMPVGPLAVLDEVSLKLMDDVLHQELADLEAEQGHGHGHDHGHGHGHEHEHGHEHRRPHEHAHAHEHEHAHGTHAHGHAQEHGQGGHERDHGCGHGHKHDHGHAAGSHEHHDHDHDDHRHDQPAAASQHAAAARPAAASHGHTHSHKVKSRRMPESAVYVLEKMAHGYKRMGRAYGAGFYDYPADSPKHLWEGLSTFKRGRKEVPLQDIKDRLLYAQAIEAARCLQENVVESARDANVGSIFGWGFPAWTGGVAQFVDHVGVRRFVERADELAQRYGERFAPPKLLRDRAAADQPNEGPNR